MSFIADKQTLDDLNLQGRFKQHSIFSLFNTVKTSGGERLLDDMFRHPLTNASAINERSNLFGYFQQLNVSFPIDQNRFQLAEQYLAATTAGNPVSAIAGMLWKKGMAALIRDEQFHSLQQGLLATIEILNQLNDLVEKLDLNLVQEAREILHNKRLAWLKNQKHITIIPVLKMVRYDFLLKNTMRQEMEALLNCIYQLDVCIAVSDLARARKFSYAKAVQDADHGICIENLLHPGLEHAKPNSLNLLPHSNMLFLTGANMAGKSTFMKSFGIAVYLAHMGFPVAADKMEFSVMDGMYSSINVPDSLVMGYSHFYAEVLRVKKVAEDVSSGKKLLVIFDELFKGTNVKDAYDATLAVTASFSKYRHCFYIISTHIIEAGEALRNNVGNLQFAYLPTIMEDHQPKYTYALTEGITGDRHGMVIIENEKILEIING